MQRFLNDENGFQNEYLVFYWALTDSFQNNISVKLYSGISVDCHKVWDMDFLIVYVDAEILFGVGK